MRILLIPPPLADVLSPGGIYKVVREIAKNLSKRGHDVTVLQLNPLNRPNEEVYEGFKIIRIDSKIANCLYGLNPEIYFYLKKHYRELNPDVVHVHGYHSLLSIESIFLIKKMDPDIYLVFSPHLDVIRSSFIGRYFWNIYKIIGKKISKMVDHIVCASNFEANNIKKLFQINENKISIISHGVDVINFNKPKKSKDVIRLLYAGYLIKRKGVQHLLRSLYSLINELHIDNVELTLIGKGPEKNNLLELAEQLKVEKHLRWKNFLPKSQFLEELKKADIFLLLSESEAYGIAVAEALALGTPVIVTKRTALEEFLNEPGCFGVDYPPDPKEVAELILKIASSDVKVGPFSNKIRTWDKVAEDYEKIYLSIHQGEFHD